MIVWMAQFRAIRHDRIANQWVPRLVRLLYSLYGEVHDTDRVELLRELIAEWRKLCSDIIELLENLEGEVTPARALDHGQLGIYEKSTQDWMRPIIHNLWVARCHIRESRQAVMERMATANVTIGDLEHSLRVSAFETIGELEDYRDRLEVFREHFRALSDALESLGIRIKDIGLPRFH